VLLWKKVLGISLILKVLIFFIEFTGNNFNCLILQRGLVVGVYIDDSGNNVKLTPAADQINQESGGTILKALKM